MIVWIVRHGCAGSKVDWWGDDDDRPLDDVGRHQARDLVALLAGESVERLIASPTVRCTETLVPLSEALGLALETSDHLKHSVPAADVIALIERVGDGAVLCTHGEVMGPLLEVAADRGFAISSRDPVSLMRKGAVWRVDLAARTLDVRSPAVVVDCGDHT